ncbi:cutinase [Coniochaeta sp. 2T2.1]|nr:cutinase [Coniochaeta sp. 2T2.1]
MLLPTTLLLALVSHVLATPIQARQSLAGSTQNGLSGSCKEYTVIFARGTTEPGNVGSVAGPPFFRALASRVGDGNLAVQGVEYPANVVGFVAGGDRAGSQTMASLVQQAMTRCPGTKVVMSGYSQGGQLVHNAAAQLPASVTANVTAAVIFGDPDNGDAVQGVSAERTKIICHVGDNICQKGSAVLLPHLTYGRDAGAAADFVVSVAA